MKMRSFKFQNKIKVCKKKFLVIPIRRKRNLIFRVSTPKSAYISLGASQVMTLVISTPTLLIFLLNLSLILYDCASMLLIDDLSSHYSSMTCPFYVFYCALTWKWNFMLRNVFKWNWKFRMDKKKKTSSHNCFPISTLAPGEYWR